MNGLIQSSPFLRTWPARISRNTFAPVELIAAQDCRVDGRDRNGEQCDTIVKQHDLNTRQKRILASRILLPFMCQISNLFFTFAPSLLFPLMFCSEFHTKFLTSSPLSSRKRWLAVTMVPGLLLPRQLEDAVNPLSERDYALPNPQTLLVSYVRS